MDVKKRALFNENGDVEVSKKRMINGNTTNLNDFNNMKYGWVSEWYRQAMNNFWIPEEINLAQDLKDYNKLEEAEKTAYDKILSFLIFLDSIQTANLGNINNYITASEINLCLTIQAFQEAVHSQSYSYMLDTICSPEKRNEILYQWKDDEVLLERNKFIGAQYNSFLEEPTVENLVKAVMANYILEGIYFYSGFMFFYNLERNGKMPGSAQEIRYINRDENTHLWLFRSIIRELMKEEPEVFTEELKEELKDVKYIDITQMKKDSNCLKEQLNNLQIDLNKQKVKLITLRNTIENIINIDKQLNDSYDIYQQYLDLSELTSGKNKYRISFERYVLAAYFENILTYANILLKRMSQGRYQLYRRDNRSKGAGKQGLELDVLDLENGMLRDVKTLSGGESFKAALSLALGLSKMIQSFTGGIELNTLFIDEGFGSLDSQSLDQAIDCLIDLQQDGKLIGIISHVSELKERIDHKIILSRVNKETYISIE